MYRRVLPYLTIAAVLACNAENSTQPPPPLSPSASPVISDGAHGAGNPDFFFLNPTVPSPKNHPHYGDPFNGSLTAVVTICELDEVPPDGNVDASSPCKTGGYTLPPTVASVDLVGEKYSVDWMVPVAAPVYYRIRVIVGTDTLGYADVKSGPTPQALKGTDANQFITRVDGSDLPIKFRIEEFALCETPGTGPCSSETVNLTTGGTVSTTFEGDDHPTGVEIQPASGAGSTTITIEECTDLNPRVTDLPTYGRCASVTADPPLTAPLAQAAVVFICNAVDDIGTSLSPAQRSRVSLHRFDESLGAGDPDSLTALPHVDPEACEAPPPSFGLGHSLKGMLADLRHGRFKSAGGRLTGLLSPKPLYAAVLDEGGGGLSFIFSDFQFALPAKMEKVPSTDNQVAPPGTLATSPKVLVTDLAGDPVANARVRFAGTTEAACLATSPSTGVLTAADGTASTSWTISQGSNTLVACGRGLADADESTNGPRAGFDPFQPIQTPFDAADPTGGPVEELVLVGSVTFSATGVSLLGSSSSGGGQSGTIEPNPGSVFSVNASTGLASLIGSSGVTSPTAELELSTLDFDPTTGTLYGIAGSACTGATLITINPSTGAGTAVGSLVGAGFDGSQPGGSPFPCTGGSDAIAIAANGTMYAGGWNGGTAGGSLLTVNKSNGVVLTRVSSSLHISGLTFDASGNLWASSGGNSPGVLHTVNLADGQVLTTLQLKTAAGANDNARISSLAYADGNVLFAALPNENKLASINTTTGVITRIGSLGTSVARMAGLTSVPPAPILNRIPR